MSQVLLTSAVSGIPIAEAIGYRTGAGQRSVQAESRAFQRSIYLIANAARDGAAAMIIAANAEHNIKEVVAAGDEEALCA